MLMYELAQPRKLVPRWLGHGDLTIVVDGPNVYVRADQLEQLADIRPWADGDALIPEGWPVDLQGVAYYRLDDALDRLEHAGTGSATAFLTWIRDTLPTLITDETLALAAGLSGFLDAFTVSQAAAQLSTDPAVSIGRDRLFRHMEQLGWVTRDRDYWALTTPARRDGVLTLRTVPVRGRSYPQVYVTQLGLTALRASLHALSVAPPPPAPTPTLFDD
jgi:hypothetical protein